MQCKVAGSNAISWQRRPASGSRPGPWFKTRPHLTRRKRCTKTADLPDHIPISSQYCQSGTKVAWMIYEGDQVPCIKSIVPKSQWGGLEPPTRRSEAQNFENLDHHRAAPDCVTASVGSWRDGVLSRFSSDNLAFSRCGYSSSEDIASIHQSDASR
jgi:hypothetical protein